MKSARELTVAPAAAIIAAIGVPIIAMIALLPFSLPLNPDHLSGSVAALGLSFIFVFPVVLVGLLTTVVPLSFLLRRKVDGWWHLVVFTLVGFVAGGLFIAAIAAMRRDPMMIEVFDPLGASYGAFAAAVWSTLVRRDPISRGYRNV